MIGSLAVNLVNEGIDQFGHKSYKFRNLAIFIQLMKQSENQVLRKNGFRILAQICEALYSTVNNKKIRRKTIQFLSNFIVNETEMENLTNAVTCLHFFFCQSHGGSCDFQIIKNSGCLAKLIVLLRFIIFFYNTSNQP